VFFSAYGENTMANDLSEVIPRILAQGLLALRGATVMPRLVNTDYGKEAKQKGDTIDVPIPSAITIQAVTAAATPPSTADTTPTKVQIALDKWYEAPFYLTDKDRAEAMSGIIPMQVSEAIKSIGDQVNSDLFALYKRVYGWAGVAGATPFASDVSEATAVRKVLNNQLAPLSPRRMVIDPDAEANALGLRAFQDASFRGDDKGIREGEIGRKLGFDWSMDQAVPTHTNANGTPGSFLVNQADVAIGDLTVIIDTGSNDPVEGDVFTVAGDTQTYAVSSYASNTITFTPAAKVAWADNAAITFKATGHIVNLAFHRDAFALAVRPLEAEGNGLGNIIRSAIDPKSRMALRLEVSREHKRTRWSFDVLYGVALVRAALAARCAG